MKRKGGFRGTIVSMFFTLVGMGIFLAILAQFGGNIGELFKWILDIILGVITSIRDSVLNWSTFQSMF